MKTLDINECAEFLKVDRSTALRLAGEGSLIGAKIGRSWVFLEDDLVEYLRAESRRQSRERIAEQTTNETLNKAVLNNASLHVSPMRRRSKRPTPDLSAYPDLTKVSQPGLTP